MLLEAMKRRDDLENLGVDWCKMKAILVTDHGGA